MAPNWAAQDAVADLILASELTPGAVVRVEVKQFNGQAVVLLHVSQVERTESGDVQVTCDEGDLSVLFDSSNPEHRIIDPGELDGIEIDMVRRFAADEMVELVDAVR